MSIDIIYIYLDLTFDFLNIKILIISFSFFRSVFFFKKTHELLKIEHLRFKVYNF